MAESVYTRAIEKVVRAVGRGASWLNEYALRGALGEGLVVKLDDYLERHIEDGNFTGSLFTVVRNSGYRFKLTDKGIDLLQSMNERKEAQKRSDGGCRGSSCRFYVDSTVARCGGCILSPDLRKHRDGSKVCFSYQPREQTSVPSWDDAPDWAMWWATNWNGRAWWFEERPNPNTLHAGWREYVGCRMPCKQTSPIQTPNWKDTRQERPKPEPVCPVCGKPVSDHYRGLCCCPHCVGKESARLRHIPETHIWCNHCGARTEGGGTEEEEADLWNRRHGR